MQRIPSDRQPHHSRLTTLTNPIRFTADAPAFTIEFQNQASSFSELMQQHATDQTRPQSVRGSLSVPAASDAQHSTDAAPSTTRRNEHAPDAASDARTQEADAHDSQLKHDGSGEALPGTPTATPSSLSLTPDTIHMLNELLLTGGPSRLAAAELRGDAKPASGSQTRDTSQPASDSASLPRTAPPASPSTSTDSGRTAPLAAVSGAGASGPDHQDATPTPPFDATSNSLDTGDPSSLRHDRHSEPDRAQTTEPAQASATAQKSTPPPISDSLASLRAFAALNAKPGTEPIRAVTATQPPTQSGRSPTMPAAQVAQSGAKHAPRTADSAQSAPSMSNQMLRGFSAAMKSNAAGGSTLISLRPHSLGELSVSVTVHEGRVSASFEATSPLAHDLLNRSLVELRDVLLARGMVIDRLDVTLRNEPHSQLMPGSARTDAQHTSQAPSGDPSQDEMGHPGGAESQSYTPGGAGNNPSSDAHDDQAWTPGHSQGSRSRSPESAEPVLEHIGQADVAWRVDGFIDTLA